MTGRTQPRAGKENNQIDSRVDLVKPYQLAKMAGVSHDTIAKVEKIEQQAAPEIKAALKSGDLSINQAVSKQHA